MTEMGDFRKPRSATTSNLDDSIPEGQTINTRRTSFMDQDQTANGGGNRRLSNPFTWRFRKRKSTDLSTTSLAIAQKTNMVNNTRPVYTHDKFDAGFGMTEEEKGFDVRSRMKKCLTCDCSKNAWKQRLYQLLPFINVMKSYNPREDLFGDIIAGLTVGIMNIPQGNLLNSCKCFLQFYFTNEILTNSFNPQ